MHMPPEVPVMTLPNATLFPQALLPLRIFERRYRQMLHDALHSHRMFAVAMQKPDRTREAPCSIAGIGLIRVSVQHNDGTSHLILQGLSRVALAKAVRTRPYRVHPLLPLPTAQAEGPVTDALTSRVLELAAQCLRSGPLSGSPTTGQPETGALKAPALRPARDILNYLEQVRSPELLADLVGGSLLWNPLQRQALLESVRLEDRLRKLIHFLLAQLAQAPDDRQP
jgi:ATP-dependent Lon protease